MTAAGATTLGLASWRRSMAELYAAVRQEADPTLGHEASAGQQRRDIRPDPLHSRSSANIGWTPEGLRPTGALIGDGRVEVAQLVRDFRSIGTSNSRSTCR
jgi:hypothetical protein